MSEIALMNREKIYLEFKNKVSAYVAGKGISGHEAEDIVADVFLKVYKNLDRYDETKASLSTWIYTITKNTVITISDPVKLIQSLRMLWQRIPKQCTAPMCLTTLQMRLNI